MNKKYIILSVLLCLSIVASAQQVWTLEQCIDTALVNNRNIKKQENTKKGREIAYQQARQNLLPNLNAGASQNFYYGLSPTSNNVLQSASNSKNSSFNMSSSITLFDGLKMKNNIDARKADLYASEANLETMREDIILSVSTVYLQVLLNKELLQIAVEQLEQTKLNIEQARKNVAAGRMAEGELYELLSQEAQEELSRVQTDNALKLSLLDLSQILEIDYFEDMEVATPEHLINAEIALLPANEVFENAVANRPEMKSAEYQLQSSEKSVAIARSSYYPTLTLGGSLSSGYYDTDPASFSDQFSNNLTSSFGFNLSIPIFNRFETRNNVRTAQLEWENTKIALEDTKIELRKKIQQAYQNALAAKIRWDAAEKSEKSAQEAFRFATQKYEAGRATQYELFQAKNNLTKVLSEQTQSKYEYVFRTMILELYNK